MQIWRQHFVSRLVGRLARCRIRWFKTLFIRWFIRHYKVDMSEAQRQNIQSYAHFTDFFIRKLLPEARPQSEHPQAIISPVDGFISELGLINDGQLLQAKGQTYALNTLLAGDNKRAALFSKGAFFNAYLSPKDYHRVHMPVSGHLESMIYVPGSLFSVNPKAVAQVPSLFARNERVICYFNTPYGLMAVIMVGAMIVAQIVTQWHGRVTPSKKREVIKWQYAADEINLSRGDEIGYFAMGSTVILLFQSNAVAWLDDQKPQQAIRLGQIIAQARYEQKSISDLIT